MATFSDTRWPQLLQASLRSAAEGASHILGGTNVLVTGATGSLTDAVVCSLIQVWTCHYILLLCSFLTWVVVIAGDPRSLSPNSSWI